MTGLVRRATVFTAVGLLAASAAFAGVPSAGTSTLGANINLCGTNGAGTIADPAAVVLKTITVRDAASNPVPNSVVVINFSACTSPPAAPQDGRLSSNQPFAGMFVNCAAKTVSAVTNGSGVASFRVVGSTSFAGANGPGATLPCATVTADGVVLGSLRVGAFDLDGVGGVLPSDGSLWQQDRNGAYRARSDYDGNLAVNPADGSLWQQIRNALGSSASGAVCP